MRAVFAALAICVVGVTDWVWGACFFAGILIAGTLQGRKQQLSNYCGSLLSQLSADGRSTLNDLAYEEAKRLESPRGRAQAA